MDAELSQIPFADNEKERSFSLFNQLIRPNQTLESRRASFMEVRHGIDQQHLRPECGLRAPRPA